MAKHTPGEMNKRIYQTDLDKLAARIAVHERDAKRLKDADNRACARQDARDLRRVHKLVRAGEHRAAWLVIRKLDTAVWEEIPTRLYNAIIALGA